VNLLLGRQVVPEFLQEDCTGPKIAEAVAEILDSKTSREAQQKDFKEVAKALGDPHPSPSERAAKVVLAIVRGKAPADQALISG
jgi:lipid-A-disaccharide synthase